MSYYPLILNRDNFEAEIGGVKCKGKVSIDENGKVYLCQNETDGGFLADDKLGYKYVWFIGYQDNIQAMSNGVQNLKILSRDDGSLVANVGDIIVHKYGKSEVLAVNGDCFLRSFLSNFDIADCCHKNSEIKKNCWKIEGREEENKAEEYIKYLEEVGRIKDGKILN